MTARGGSADDRNWRAWVQQPNAALALTLAVLWVRERRLLTESDEYLDALVALASGEVAPRRVWGPLRQLAKFLLDDSALERAERLPSYWTEASVCRVPEGWQARVGRGSAITTVGAWPTRDAAEAVCRALRPAAVVEFVTLPAR